MWLSIGLALVLLACCVFLSYLALEENEVKAHDLLIGGAAICGSLAVFILVVILLMVTLDLASAAVFF